MPFATPFATAGGAEVAREGLLLRCEAADGLVGLGEASPVPAFGAGTLADTLPIVADLAPRLVGLGPDEADALLAGLDLDAPGVAAAACAFDTALLDLRARRAGLPLHRLLGATSDEPLPVNATIGGHSPAEAARGAVAAGFRCVKLKVGLAASDRAEVERIAEVRATIGPLVRLRLDANGAWHPDQAIAILRAVEPYAVELVEQPVPAADLAGLARVRAAVGVPIAADESVGTPDQARRVIDAGAADLLVVKPMLAGGPRPARAILELARAAGLGAIVTTTIDSGVATAMALHLAATLPPPRATCGLATTRLLVGDLVLDAPAVHDGTMRPPSGPGLGVRLDPAQLARFGGGWQEAGY